MYTTINEFKKFINEYNETTISSYYQQLIKDGSNEQDALLNTAEFFETTQDQINNVLRKASNFTLNNLG